MLLTPSGDRPGMLLSYTALDYASCLPNKRLLGSK